MTIHHMTTSLMLAAFGLLLICSSGCISAYPSHTTEQVVMVEEIVRLSTLDAGENNITATLITLSETSVESKFSQEQDKTNESSADDLIFAVKPQKQLSEPNIEDAVQRQRQIDLPTTDDIISLTEGQLNEALQHDLTYKRVANNAADVHAHNDDVDSEEEEHDDTAVDIYRQRNVQQTTFTGAGSKPIDLSDFLALIPLHKVKLIADNYYRNDPEVQRAYKFLRSQEFNEIWQKILQLPEMIALMRYLDDSGLNVFEFFKTITSRTCTLTDTNVSNDINNTPNEPVLATTIYPLETTTTEQLNGIHGLIDSILDVLPQDQILSVFFDKLETDEQFSHAVGSISNPKFAKILNNLQNSMALRNFVFLLHQNGIYLARIVDSLKSFFFLGTL